MFATLLQNAEDRGEMRLHSPAPDLAHYLLFNAYSLGIVARVGRSKAQLERYVDITLSVLGDPGQEAAA